MALNFGRIRIHRHLLLLNKLSRTFYSKLDTIDEFTTNLMQLKFDKWEKKKREIELACFPNSKANCFNQEPTNFHLLGNENVSDLYRIHVENDDIGSIVNLIKKCKIPPPLNLTIRILILCAHNGEKECILQIRQLYHTHNPQFLEENSHLNHFLAEAIWINGDVSKAVELFEQVYRENAYLRRRIRLVLRYLINNLVANGSQAAFANMMQFSENLITYFHDYTPMIYIWEACFLSALYSDQNIAISLLECSATFRKKVECRIPYVVSISLKCHRTEIVYRLLEALLKFDMKYQARNILGSLLDYLFRLGNWNQCCEIIKWSAENDIVLPKSINIKFIRLVLDKTKEVSDPDVPETIVDPPKYKF